MVSFHVRDPNQKSSFINTSNIAGWICPKWLINNPKKGALLKHHWFILAAQAQSHMVDGLTL
jgi:hypothetical protein